MKRHIIAVAGVALFACRPSYDEGQGAKSPDEILAEQERLGAESEKTKRDPSDYAEPTEATDEEQKRQWDAKYAELELRRSSRSAETCPDAVTEKVQRGMAHVTLVFANDGRAKDATVAAPYAETVVGKCILRAMGKAIVKPFEGPEKTIEWQVDLTGKHKSGPMGGGGGGEEKPPEG